MISASPDDNPPFAADPVCPACLKPWKDHKGISLTCHELQLQKALFKELTDTHMKLLNDFADYKRRNPPQTPPPPFPQ